jgi:two-component system cell cycle response regulator DivK
MEKVILIIEDEPRNIKIVHDLLLANNYTPLEATDGRQGVELARAYQPALILMDIQMPGLDGLAATRILKADPETQRIPVIALTAYAMPGDADQILQAGCDSYITKPFHIQALLSQVAKYLSE